MAFRGLKGLSEGAGSGEITLKRVPLVISGVSSSAGENPGILHVARGLDGENLSAGSNASGLTRTLQMSAENRSTAYGVILNYVYLEASCISSVNNESPLIHSSLGLVVSPHIELYDKHLI